jgi:hypothetical protein
MAKQPAATTLSSGSATAGQAAIGDRIADELVAAIELGIDADDYCAARGAGANHQECLEAVERQVDLWHYAWSREYGATHAEVMEVLDRKAGLVHYARARRSGATHAEAIEQAQH